MRYWTVISLFLHQSWQYSCQVRGHETRKDLERATHRAPGQTQLLPALCACLPAPLEPSGHPLFSTSAERDFCPRFHSITLEMNSAKRNNSNSPWTLSRYPHPLFNKVSDFLKSLSLKLEVLIIVRQNKWKSWNCLPFVVWIQVRSTGTRLEGFNHPSLECSGRGEGVTTSLINSLASFFFFFLISHHLKVFCCYCFLKQHSITPPTLSEKGNICSLWKVLRKL